ncbi:MAG: LexA family transcriptional regulator [Deltaproteobacteria bacterium]|nr:LexA family transcriptional regulator [Deltaproteobacteria bacterium]
MSHLPEHPIVEKIRTFWQRHRRGPSYSELAQLAGYASKQAAYRLAQKLVDAGLLTRDATGRLALDPTLLRPRLLGAVQAGFPSPAEEELIDTISLDEYLIRKPAESFLLKVNGDSMRDAGILPDDLVIIERGRDPHHGDIVLAEVDGAWTLKYYQRHGKSIRLVPANPKYPVIEPKSELKIGGVVRATMRRY